MKRGLFQIGQDLLAFNELIDENDGEIMPDAEKHLDLWFADLQSDQEAKLTSYVAVVKRLDMEAKFAAEEAKMFARKQQAREASIERLKKRLLEHFLATGQKDAKTADGRKVWWQNTGGRRTLDIREDVTIPDEYMVVPAPVVDRERIYQECKAYEDAVAAGQEPVAGPLEFARLLPQGKHIRIA